MNRKIKMKKYSFIPVLLLAFFLLLTGCSEKKEEAEKVDYSAYPFVGNAWEREAENDIETIFFGADGSFRYYCSCGNPVNDSDLCEGYTYDDETKTITPSYLEETEEMVSAIKVVHCDDTELSLDFDGEIRIFTK